jgi:hypothetical protein
MSVSGLVRIRPWYNMDHRWSGLMRKDMARVIVERPRILDGIGLKGRSPPLDELPRVL